VVDDGSRDTSVSVVERWTKKNQRVRLVRHEKNLGYGAAVRTALQSASKDLVFLADGDNQFRVSEIEKLFSKIDSCDVVTGYRLSRRDNWLRRTGGDLWHAFARVALGISVRDVDCGFKLYRRRVLEGLPIESNHVFVHAEILARLRKKGRRVEEIGMTHYPRTAGKASATSPAKLFKSLGEAIRLYGRVR
ncbi:MAG TPA: glycosyltransferase family 2 protein, partial [Candidatus Omnitrophota bacterium]|nr:glycosyltransferase family 2 protein [Candidatus Omnitrophota bacterium]